MITSPSLVLVFAAVFTQPPQALVDASVERAVPLLVRAAQTHIEKKSCFGCHNQAFPMIAFAALNDRAKLVPNEVVPSQIEHILQFVKTNRENYTSGKGTGGQVDTAGWILHTLELANHTADENTAAVVTYLLKKNADQPRWSASSNRPPSEASQFTANDLAVRALKKWGEAADRDAIQKRVASVAAWARKTEPKDTEDRVYRLRLLAACDVSEDVIQEAAKELRKLQNRDGGWSQTSEMPSDAYATGSVLATLAEVKALDPKEAAYRRGVGFLLATQLPDGSWFVKSRSKPFQPYYEGGFPHGKDQFISSTASAWAVAALAKK